MMSAAAFGAVTGGIGVGLSVIDMIRGNRMAKKAEQDLKNLNRPMMGVTQAQSRQVGLAEQMANQNMPGYSIAQNQIQNQTAQTLANVNAGATSSADLMSAATTVGMNNTNALNNLAMQNEEQKRQGMLNLQDTLGGLDETQKAMFEANQMVPFREKQAVLNANRERGQGLVDQGMQGIGNSIGQSMPYLSAGGGKFSSWENFRSMYGSPTTT
jgi:hypothetical protein